MASTCDIFEDEHISLEYAQDQVSDIFAKAISSQGWGPQADGSPSQISQASLPGTLHREWL